MLFYLPSSNAITSHPFPYRAPLYYLQPDRLYLAVLLYLLPTSFCIYLHPPSLNSTTFPLPQSDYLYSGIPFFIAYQFPFLSVVLFCFLSSCNLYIHIWRFGARSQVFFFFLNTSLWPVMLLLRNLLSLELRHTYEQFISLLLIKILIFTFERLILNRLDWVQCDLWFDLSMPGYLQFSLVLRSF